MSTKSNLQDELENCYKIINNQLDDITKLKKELENEKERHISIRNDLLEIIDNLKRRSLEINKSTQKTHNERNAGRKPFSDFKIVKKIFKMYFNGFSLQKIADKFNKDNIKTPAGGTWSKSSIRFILINPMYIEKGVISDELFRDVSKRLLRQKT